MILTGVIINFAAIILGSAAGLLLKKGIPESMGESVMKAIALCVIYIGISGSLDGENVLIVIISMAAGTVIGEALSLQERLERLGAWVQSKCRPSENGVSVAEGFVNASLLFCIGAMAIVGSLQSGLSLDHSTLIDKSLIDGITAVILASSMGIGVMFSSILCFLYEGCIVVCAGFLEPYLTASVINEMTCVGSLLIIGIGINMMFKNRIRVMNSIPAVLLPILLCRLM